MLQALSSTASAQAPSTLTLDRLDSSTRIVIDTGVGKIDGVGLDDGRVWRLQPHVQQILVDRLMGIYGTIPLSAIHSSIDEEESEGGIGNLDVGAFFLPTRNDDVILRIGLALPTADSDLKGSIVNITSTVARIGDFVLAAPEYTLMRLSASTIQQHDIFFFRGDVGLDHAISKDDDDDTTNSFLRLNGAAGLRLEPVDLSVEVASVGTLDHPGSNRFIHTLAFGLCTRGPDQLRLGAVIPLDDSLSDMIDWFLLVGYQHVGY